MKINDVVSGTVLGALAAALYLHARTFPQMPGQNVGPNMFPQLIAVGLMICSIFLVVRGARTLASEGWVGVPDWIGGNRITIGFLLIPLALVFYTVVSESLGFIVTSILLLLALFLVFGVRTRTALIVAVLGTLGIHAMFYKILKVPLPWGVLSPIAW